MKSEKAILKMFFEGQEIETIAGDAMLRENDVWEFLDALGVTLEQRKHYLKTAVPDRRIGLKHDEGLSVTQISLVMGHSRPFIRSSLYRTERLKLEDVKAGASKKDLGDLIKLGNRYTAGESMQSIANSLGVHMTTVRSRLVDQDIRIRPANHNRSPLTVEVAVSLYESGLTLAEIAERYDTTPMTVRKRLMNSGGCTIRKVGRNRGK